MKIGYFWKISLYCLILNVIHFCLKDNHIYHHSDARFAPKSPLYAALSETVIGRKWVCMSGRFAEVMYSGSLQQTGAAALCWMCPACSISVQAPGAMSISTWQAAPPHDNKHRLHAPLHAQVHVVFPAVTATVCSGAHLLFSNVISSFHVCLL